MTQIRSTVRRNRNKATFDQLYQTLLFKISFIYTFNHIHFCFMWAFQALLWIPRRPWRLSTGLLPHLNLVQLLLPYQRLVHFMHQHTRSTSPHTSSEHQHTLHGWHLPVTLATVPIKPYSTYKEITSSQLPCPYSVSVPAKQCCVLFPGIDLCRFPGSQRICLSSILQ